MSTHSALLSLVSLSCVVHSPSSCSETVRLWISTGAPFRGWLFVHALNIWLFVGVEVGGGGHSGSMAGGSGMFRRTNVCAIVWSVWYMRITCVPGYWSLLVLSDWALLVGVPVWCLLPRSVSLVRHCGGLLVLAPLGLLLALPLCVPLLEPGHLGAEISQIVAPFVLLLRLLLLFRVVGAVTHQLTVAVAGAH